MNVSNLADARVPFVKYKKVEDVEDFCQLSLLARCNFHYVEIHHIVPLIYFRWLLLSRVRILKLTESNAIPHCRNQTSIECLWKWSIRVRVLCKSYAQHLELVILSDIAGVILSRNFRRVFPKLDYPVCTLRILARHAEISIIRKIFYSVRRFLTLFPYPRPRRCLKFTQETTENYARASNALSQAPDARKEHTASCWIYASWNRCTRRFCEEHFF